MRPVGFREVGQDARSVLARRHSDSPRAWLDDGEAATDGGVGREDADLGVAARGVDPRRHLISLHSLALAQSEI
jgi:hypothetical protein